MKHRKETVKVLVKNIQIGGNNDVVIQSMLTEKTFEVDKVLKKISQLADIGCEIIRLSCFDQRDVDALKIICKKSPIPVVADIHYNYKYAIQAVENGVSKIRINPGNIKQQYIAEIAKTCKKYKVPIRVGVNIGSLEPDLFLRYGFSAKALLESAKRAVLKLEKEDFFDIIISLKSSDPKQVVEVYTEAAKFFPYPLHLGVTEAGSLTRAIVKSSCALGKLLEMGIGNTIRVSISDDPVYEIKVAKELLRYYNIKKNFPNLISCPTCGRLNFNMLPLVKEIETFLDKITGKVNVAIMGCTVNGPGEAKNADIALCGEINEAHLYIDGKFKKTLVDEEIVPEFKAEILDYIKNKTQKNSD